MNELSQPLGVWSRTYTFDAYEVGNTGNWGKLRYGAGCRECRTGNNSGKLGINRWKTAWRRALRQCWYVIDSACQREKGAGGDLQPQLTPRCSRM